MNHRERMRQRRKKPASEQFSEGNSQTGPSIELRINELVLSGLGFATRGQIAGSVQSELANLLGEHGLPRNSLTASTLERIDGGTISLPRNEAAERTGNKIARAVYGGLSAGNGIGGHESTKT